MFRQFRLSAVMLGLAAPAFADEIILGAGHSYFNAANSQNRPVLSLEYRRDPTGRLFAGRAGLALGIDAHSNGDLFAGLGLGLRWDLGARWFFDLSVLPGLWKAADPRNDIGGALQFRSTIGIGYRFDNGAAMSFALSHKSNAHIEAYNPGLDTVLLRWHMTF